MTVIQAAILGVIEGATEFLPVSSTFHLLFASQFLGIQESEFTKFFDVFIQAGAMLPIVALYFSEWFKNKELLKKVAVSFVPTAIVGFVLHKVIKDVFFDSNMLMIAAFFAVGILFFIVEWLVKQGKVNLKKDIADLTYTQAIAIGLFQACAVLPGVSRAGAVIVGMMFLGVKRDEAAKYSFSLAVPTILAAAAYDLLKSHPASVLSDSSSLIPLLVGSVVAMLSAFAVVKWFIEFLRKHSLAEFGVYRVVASVLLLFAGAGK
jgi:undecaprenyl-diphosphatase